MANAATHPIAAPAPVGATADVSPVFVIDAAGRVVATNRSACVFWATGNQSMVGLNFVQLFEPDPGNDVAGFETRWTALRAAAFESWTPLVARTLRTDRAVTRVRLERSIGGAGTYIAIVLPQPA